MYLLIQKFNIDSRIVKDLFDGVETDLKEKLTFHTKKELIIKKRRDNGVLPLLF